MPKISTAVLGSALLGALLLFVLVRFQLSTSMLHFLPSEGDRPLREVSAQLVDSALSRTMVLTVADNGKGQQALAAVKEWQPRLTALAGVKAVRVGPPEGIERAFYELYFDRRLSFVSADPERQLQARFSEAALVASFERLKRELTGPSAQLVRSWLPRDPWGAFAGVLERLQLMQPQGLHTVNGQFLAADGQAVLFLTLSESALNGAAQRRLLLAIEDSFSALNARAGSPLALEYTGLNRFAVASELAMKADLKRVSLLSAACVVLLFVVLFRSFRRLLLALLPLGVGFLAGVSASLLLFGQVHAVTLAFGGALLGVCIDYPMHLFNHHDLSKRGTLAEATARHIWPALALASVTTLAGLAGLATTSLPGVREIALFSVFGVAAALLTTRWLLPSLMKRGGRVTVSQSRLSTVLVAGFRRLSLQRNIARGLVLLVLVVIACGLPRVRWQDDLNALNALDQGLVAEDARVRSRVGSLDSGRFALAIAPDLETALQQSELLYQQLVVARSAGEIGSFSSSHGFLWSQRLQQRNRDTMAAIPDLVQRTERALEQAGFDSSAFADLESELQAQPSPLTLALLKESPVATLIDPFIVELDDGVALVSYLRGVERPTELQARLAPLFGIHYLDQRELLNGDYALYRQQALYLVGVGFLLVCALVLARYRRASLLIATILPSFLAGAASLATLALLGESLHLIHVLALVLVLSIGVDYAVFLVENRERRAPRATLLSIALACLSTVFSFGVLGLSAVPALSALGQTIALGVVYSLLLAPACFVSLAVGHRVYEAS